MGLAQVHLCFLTARGPTLRLRPFETRNTSLRSVDNRDSCPPDDPAAHRIFQQQHNLFGKDPHRINTELFLSFFFLYRSLIVSVSATALISSLVNGEEHLSHRRSWIHRQPHGPSAPPRRIQGRRPR